MSHVVEIQTEIRDPVALQSACQRLSLKPPIQGRYTLFMSEATGWGVHLPAWKFPVVCDTASGQIKYDNYEGRWGEVSKLHLLLQSYAVEKAKLEARRQGHAVYEQPAANGAIKVTIQVA